jgi:uncharacterized protein (TIGR03083 family)
MIAGMDRVLEAFEGEGRALLAVVRVLTADALARPTNCPPWTLAELCVHVAGSIRVGTFISAENGAVARESADYYRRPERSTVEYRDHNVRLAQRQARQVQERMTVSECLASALRDTSVAMAEDDLDRVVEIDRVGPMRLGGWLATRVVALAAHGLDVAITLEVQPWTTPSALAVMRPIFLSLLGRAAPVDWSDQRLLEVATGRAQLTDRDRSELGPAAGRFPLLS